MNNDLTFELILISLISILILILANFYLANLRAIQVINFLFLCEAFVLTFKFQKFSSLLSLFILATSLYFILYQNKNNNFLFENAIVDSIFPLWLQRYFPILGVAGFFSIIIYEYFGDGIFSSSDLLIFFLSSILLFFHKVPRRFSSELDFLLVFNFLLSLFFVVPSVLYKLKFGLIGEENSGYWYDGYFLTSFLLTKPLAKLLTFMGFTVVAEGAFLSYEDLTTNTFQKVHISENCAGINSIKIFSAALISYMLVSERRLNSKVLSLLLFGVYVSYFANLIRMAIIVISGHYYGSEVMLFVHTHVGWLIFTAWLYLFWIVSDRFITFSSRLTGGVTE